MNVIEGIGMGLLLSLIVGPVFFALIQNSIEKGFKYAVAMAAGIVLSDSIYVLVSYFGVTLVTQNPLVEVVLGYVGGVFLIGFGVVSFVKKSMDRPSTGGISAGRPLKRKGFLKGFSLNGVNPFVMLFWVSIASMIRLKEAFSALDVIGFYLGMLLTSFIVDVIKAYGAAKIKNLITPNVMLNLNRFVAVALVLFGIRMIKFAFDTSQALA
jgi:threonine/homoserine/homoserine lactone efflux protein